MKKTIWQEVWEARPTLADLIFSIIAGFVLAPLAYCLVRIVCPCE